MVVDSDLLLVSAVVLSSERVVSLIISDELWAVASALVLSRVNLSMGCAAEEMFNGGNVVVSRSDFDTTSSLTLDRRHFRPTRISHKYIPASFAFSLHIVIDAFPHA